MSRAQLLEAGLSKGGIEWRLRNGSLVTRYTGVYALAPTRMDAQAVIAAAVLAGGPTAVASHASAAWLWGFLSRCHAPPEISLPAGIAGHAISPSIGARRYSHAISPASATSPPPPPCAPHWTWRHA